MVTETESNVLDPEPSVVMDWSAFQEVAEGRKLQRDLGLH